jgi:hypothetical protein
MDTSTSASEIRMAGIQGRDGLALQRRDDLRILDVAPQHRIKIAAALASEATRCRRAGKGRPAPERIRQRRARPHLSCTSSRTVRKTGDVTRRFRRSSDCTGGIPAFEQCGEFLVEHEKLARVDPRLRQAQRQPGDRSLVRSDSTYKPFSSSRGAVSPRSRRHRRLRNFAVRRARRQRNSTLRRLREPGPPAATDCL